MDLDSEIQGSNKIDTAIPRQLVLDYLLHNCYGETARAFMKDDLDAVKDSAVTSTSTTSDLSNGRKNGTATTTNGSFAAASIVPQGGVMTRNASSESSSNGARGNEDDIHHRRAARHAASLMMETEKEGLDQEGDSPMGESYLDTRDSLSTSTFTPDKAHALHIDEQLKNLETRKAIRSLISMGDIGPAMDMCNAAFPGVLSIDPHSPLTTPSSIHMNFKLQCQKFIEIVKSDPERGPDALMFAQQVLSDFTRLDPVGRDKYIKHMEEIVSVIAFSNPEDSPNGHHLKQEARDHLADIMNSAVLGCNGAGKMEIIIFLGGVELNGKCGDGSGSGHDKKDMTS
ncbi:Ran-binding protein 9 [Linnemannia exigua]|uniref:Ran-binding protein 9 n=1 Tax=Linnemannia exigua TaxID=604196 RepID=A0AAD4D868_9FUNG|nr:Ran-binding protein 9 [Linnemannia exigua]